MAVVDRHDHDVDPFDILMVNMSKRLSSYNCDDLKVLYNHAIPEETRRKQLSGLEALTYLRNCGHFSKLQPEGLVRVMKNIDRCDLADHVNHWIVTYTPKRSRTKKYLDLLDYSLEKVAEAKNTKSKRDRQAALCCVDNVLQQIRSMMLMEQQEDDSSGSDSDNSPPSGSDSDNSPPNSLRQSEIDSYLDEPQYVYMFVDPKTVQSHPPPAQVPQYVNFTQVISSSAKPAIAQKPKHITSASNSSSTDENIYAELETTCKSGDAEQKQNASPHKACSSNVAQEITGRAEKPRYANIKPQVAPKPRRVQAGTAHAKQPSAPSAGTEDYIYTQTSSKSGDSGFCEPKEWVGESAPLPPPAPATPSRGPSPTKKPHQYMDISRNTLDEESEYQEIIT